LTKLEKILKEKGLKQIWLANKINKSPPELNRWVKGIRKPPYKIMYKISKAIDVPVERIFLNDADKEDTNDNSSAENTSIGDNNKPE